MFERPLLLLLLLAAPLAVAPGWLRMRRGENHLGVISLILRLICFSAIVLALAGFRIPSRGRAARLEVVVAMDHSRSIAPDQQAWMAAKVAALRHALTSRDRLGVLAFGRNPVVTTPLGARVGTPITPGGLDSSATDLGDALVAARGLFSPGGERRIWLLSDGNQTRGDVLDQLSALRQDGVRVYTAAPPPSTAPRAAITAFAAPGVVRARASFPIQLTLENESAEPAPALLQLYTGGRLAGAQHLTLAPGASRLELPYHLDQPGAYTLKAELSMAAPQVVLNPVAETTISVAAPPRVLVIAANPAESLVNALELRGYQVDGTGPRALPIRAVDYLPYQAVIIVNTPASALSDPVQAALADYVADYGGGLAMAGDSLRDLGFQDGPLENVLPVKFVAQPPPPTREPIAVYLLIDRSNSMSYDSRYPALRDYERIRYAKQAAEALLKQLDDTDYAGVIAFDSEPYVLGHLRPLGEDRAELLDRVERLEPGGGTDFKESLSIAEHEILNSGIAVREVILLTDGDTNRQYHDHDQLMADFTKENIPVSTIRIGPDLENLNLLQDFAHNTGGLFYRVSDISKLPQLLVHLTHEAQNFKLHERARVDLGTPSAILDGIDTGTIPPIDYFAITQPKDGAQTALLVRKGQVSAPLLTTWQFELGRTAVFAGDPDSMGSLHWIRWSHYAEFWSQLVTWIARTGDPGLFSLTATPSAQGAIELKAEKADAAPTSNLFCRISGAQTSIDVALTQTGPATYRAETPNLAPGKYSLALMLKAGDSEQVLLRREVAVPHVEAADAAELRLRDPDIELLRQLAHATGGDYTSNAGDVLRGRGAQIRLWRPAGGLLLPLAILALLADIFTRRRLVGRKSEVEP